MKTNCPCGGLLHPAVAGRLSVWLVHVRLSGFVLKDCLSIHRVFTRCCFWCSSFGWLTFCPPWLVPLVFSGRAQTVWLMDTLLFGSFNQSMSWPACPSAVSPWQNISRPSVFSTDAINLNLQNAGSAVTPPFLDALSVVSTATAPSSSLKATSFG